MEELIAEIAASDRAAGWMALQICASAEDGRYYPALAALFMLTEQILRWATDAEDKEVLKGIILRAQKENLISEEEMRTLETMRSYRNMYLHADFHGEAFESEGLLYPINDEEAAQVAFDSIALPCLQIVANLVR